MDGPGRLTSPCTLHIPSQKKKFATGLDTACVKGKGKDGKLTALVIPSLHSLLRSNAISNKLGTGQPLTRDEMEGDLVDVSGPKHVKSRAAAAAGGAGGNDEDSDDEDYSDID